MLSLRVKETTGRFYTSIPVSNAMVDYEEYYEIDHPTFDRFQKNLEQALAFVTLCRQRKVDDLLMVQPVRIVSRPSEEKVSRE